MLKGNINRLDYAASAHIDVEIPNGFLNGSLDALLSRWQQSHPMLPGTKCNAIYVNTDKNVIVIAQTGMGKTEGGLLWLGNLRVFSHCLSRVQSMPFINA